MVKSTIHVSFLEHWAVRGTKWVWCCGVVVFGCLVCNFIMGLAGVGAPGCFICGWLGSGLVLWWWCVMGWVLVWCFGVGKRSWGFGVGGWAFGLELWHGLGDGVFVGFAFLGWKAAFEPRSWSFKLGVWVATPSWGRWALVAA
ncbi:hypothetical protein QBC39DRAFT_358821 [Podospora conica]|nr:hypothetical protein QBC39DRAFT_358821 [Schizothecium conicum]